MTEPVGLPEEAGVQTEDPTAEGPPLPPQEGRVEREPPTIGVPRPSLPLPDWVVEALQPEISPLGPSPRRTAANKYLRNLQRRMGDNLTGADYVELITEAVNVLGAAGPVVAARRRPSPPQPRTVASPRPVPEQVEGRVPQPVVERKMSETGKFITGPDFDPGVRQDNESKNSIGQALIKLRTHPRLQEWTDTINRYKREGRDKIGPVLVFPKNISDVATHLIDHPNGLSVVRPIDILDNFYPGGRALKSPNDKARYYADLVNKSRADRDKLEFERFLRPTVVQGQTMGMLVRKAEKAAKDPFARPMNAMDADATTRRGPFRLPSVLQRSKLPQDQQDRLAPLFDAQSRVIFSDRALLKGPAFIKSTLLHEFTHVPDVAFVKGLGEKEAFVFPYPRRDVRSEFAKMTKKGIKAAQKALPGLPQRSPFVDVIDAYTQGLQNTGYYNEAMRKLSENPKTSAFTKAERMEAREAMKKFYDYHGSLVEKGAWFYSPMRKEMTRATGKVPKTVDDVISYANSLTDAIDTVTSGQRMNKAQRKVLTGFIDVIYKQTDRPQDLTATLRELRRAEPGRKGGTGLPLSKKTFTYLNSFANFWDLVKTNPKLAEEFLMFVQAVDEEDPEKRRKLIMNKLDDIMRRG